MSSTSLGVFAHLYKWARGQDENFCTEGLIFILRLALEEEPSFARSLCRCLSNGLIGLETDRVSQIQVQGQVVSNMKRPDIQISCGNRLAWVEVKVDDFVRPKQPENYRSELMRQTAKHSLTLLWRQGEQLPSENAPDKYLRWIELSVVIRQFSDASFEHTNKLRHLVSDYLRFLESRQLAMSKISPEVAHSIQDVGCLIRTLSELLTRANLHAPASKRAAYRITPDSMYFGYPVCSQGWIIGSIGFNFLEPQYLFFTTDGHDNALKLNLAKSRERLEFVGECIMENRHWTLSVDLSEAVDFLNMDNPGQLDWLRENFLTPSVTTARELFELADNPAANTL